MLMDFVDVVKKNYFIQQFQLRYRIPRFTKPTFGIRQTNSIKAEKDCGTKQIKRANF